MRIIIFDGTFKTTAFIRRLLQGLVKAGHEVHVLGFNEDNNNTVPYVNYVGLGSNQSKFVFLKSTLRWFLKSDKKKLYLRHTLRNNKSQLQHLNLTAALETIKPDIVHLQWVSNINLFEPFLEKRLYNFVLSQRGYQTNVRPFVNHDNHNYLEKWLPLFNGFHSVSKAISKEGDKIYHHKDKIDQIVYTGLDLVKFPFSPSRNHGDVLNIISVGRTHWKKGYDLAIRAIAGIQNSQLNCHYKIIGGKGNEELLFLINDLGLTDHIELLDQMPQKEVFELMHQADVFLLPSLEEGIANVAVEAMALGVPVISTNCGGMEELITHNKEGWIVPVYDVNALASQLLEFSKLQERDVMKVVNFARAKVDQQHNEDQMVKGMMQLYEKVVK